MVYLNLFSLILEEIPKSRDSSRGDDDDTDASEKKARCVPLRTSESLGPGTCWHHAARIVPLSESKR